MRRALTAAAPALACLAAALAVTWPLALHPFDAVPLGSEGEPTTTIFNIWALWWNAESALRGFTGYWDAPIFFPTPGAFAFSEPQPLTGLAVAPLWWLGAPPALAYNAALLAHLVLNGVFARRAAAALGAGEPASLLCGVLAVALPFTAKESGVLHSEALWGMLWCAEGLVRFASLPSWRAATWACAGMVAQWGTCQQHALLFAPFALALGIVALARAPERAKAALRLGGAGALALAVLVAFAWPAMRVQDEMGLRRSERVVQSLSAAPADFVKRPATATLGFPSRGRDDRSGLFPGALLLGLAIAGAWAGARERTTRAWVAWLGGTLIVASLLALGLNTPLFAALRDHTTAFARLRSPYRFAAVAQLMLPLLAALALARLRPRAATALALLAAAENVCVPVLLTAVPRSARAPWTAWLRAQPEGTAVAHVPFPAGILASEYEIEARRMLAQTFHHKPLVNGYSGAFPQERLPDGRADATYTRFQLAMARDFPTLPLLCTLQHALAATHVVAERAYDDPHLPLAFTDGETRIYTLAVPAEACPKPGPSR
jgi:hypothetical protein